MRSARRVLFAVPWGGRLLSNQGGKLVLFSSELFFLSSDFSYFFVVPQRLRPPWLSILRLLTGASYLAVVSASIALPLL